MGSYVLLFGPGEIEVGHGEKNLGSMRGGNLLSLEGLVAGLDRAVA